MGTKEFGKMMKRKNPNSRGKNSPSQRGKELEIREKKRITRKEYQRLLHIFEMEGLLAQKGLWNLAEEKIMKERGRLPNEEGDVVKEYKAMHEGDFWSRWQREDERGKDETMTNTERKEEEKGEKRKREEEKEEYETVKVKRASVEAFEIFRQGEDLKSCGDLSWGDLLGEPDDLSDCMLVSCELVRVVPDVSDVIDVLVSLPSVVTELCDVSSSCSGWEFVEPQSFFFLPKTCTLLYRYAVRRLTRESASAFKKNDDTAHTYAKFAHLL